jgi:hypothetical protein
VSVEKKAVVTMPEGPSLDAMMRRLLDVPPDFFNDAGASTSGRRVAEVNVLAVVHDVVAVIFSDPSSAFSAAVGSPIDGVKRLRSGAGSGSGVSAEVVNRESLDRFEGALQRDTQGRAAGFALLFAWLLADPWFGQHAGTRISQKRVWSTFTTLAVAHGSESTATAWHGDPKRREEIVRSMLATLELVPEGETEAQADDRLTRVSSAHRKRLLAAAREAEARSELVREALAAKAAQEAADKYTRE